MIRINHTGHNYRNKPYFEISRPKGSGDYLLLLLKSNAFFNLNQKILFTVPNIAILFQKGVPQHYGSYGTEYIDDWIHLDFDEEEPFADGVPIPFQTPVLLPAIGSLSNLILQMANEKYCKNAHSEANLDYYMRILLNKLKDAKHSVTNSIKAHVHYPKMENLRMLIHNEPYKNWTVAMMSENLQMSSSYFQHLYKYFFGISCIQDVIQIRIEYAKYNLIKTDLSIQAVADLCGYENEVHFMRQFKKIEGLTPNEYRKTYSEFLN